MLKWKNDRYVVLIIVLIGLLGYFFHLYRECYRDYGHKVVICIPVYGQSYALGEEAQRITNFDSLRIKYNGRIVTENLDYTFGYYDHSSQFKQWIKRILHYDRKAFELSVYSMAEILAQELGEDTVICIFPGGHGMNTIQELMNNDLNTDIKNVTNKKDDIPIICYQTSMITKGSKLRYGVNGQFLKGGRNLGSREICVILRRMFQIGV